MKIAIITSGFLPIMDGVTVSGLQRLKRLSQWGHEVILFCPDYSSLEADYPNWRDYTGNILPGVEIVNLASNAFVGLDYEPNVSPKSYKTLLTELEEFQPDIIHVDEPERLFVGFWRVPGVDYAKGANIPCVSFFRTNFLDYLEDYFPLPKPIFMAIKYLLRKLIVWVYNSYDLTLVTSTVTYPKVMDLGIKNANAAGIPVLAPNSEGIIENIQHGSNGFLYSPGDRHDFINKLQTLIENQSLRQEMGDRARNSVRAYSWEQAIENLVDIWQSAINNQQSTVNIQQVTVNSYQ